MKTFSIILVLFLLAINMAYSQSTRSCCEDQSVPASMDAYWNDKDFAASHPEPLPFHLTDGKGVMITFKTSDGTMGNGYEVKANNPSGKWLLIFHEWYGLNDYIKQEAENWNQKLGDVNVLAVDLYDGKVASNNDEASKYVQSVDPKRAVTIINGAIDYAGSDAIFGTLGWCFGGGWSNQAAIILESKCKACVMYYGMPESDLDKLSKLQAPVLGIFGKLDTYITPAVVAKFEENMKSLGKSITVYEYDAVHAFANPSNPKHDPDATKDANEKALAFFQNNLK